MTLIRLLTKEEYSALPVGAKVMVRWSGGNGPHEYVVGEYGKLFTDDGVYVTGARTAGSYAKTSNQNRGDGLRSVNHVPMR